jgi:ribosome-associated heat shock protein Hsp15
VKTRGLAAKLVQTGKVRINGRKIDKPDAKLRVDDILTLAPLSSPKAEFDADFGLVRKAPHIKLLRVLALGERRGSPLEAGMLYQLLKAEDAQTSE